MGCFFYAQQIIVKDSLSGIPLEGAQIKTLNKHPITETNYLGKASLPHLDHDSVRVAADKYKTKIIRISNLSSTEENVIYLDSEIFKLSAIIVTGKNWKRNRSQNPSNSHEFTEKDIHLMNASTTADVLNHATEVYIQKSQLGGGSPIIRGYSTNRLLISVDGVNMNNAIFRSGNIQNIIAIDPNSLQNIDILPGPGSVLYGSDAIGGVMNFETKTVLPTKRPHIDVTAIAGYGSAADEKKFHADIQFSSAKLTNLTSFSHQQFGDLTMGKNGPDDYLRKHYVIQENGEDIMIENDNPLIQRNTGYSQFNLLQKIAFHPHTKANFTATFSMAKTSDVPRYDRLIRYRDSNLRSAEWYYGPQEWIFSALSGEFLYKNNFFDEFKSTLSHQYFTESRHDRNFNSNIKNNYFERVNLFSWDNNFKKELHPNHELFYGLDLRHNHVNSSGFQQNTLTGDTQSSQSRYPDGSDWTQFGMYTKLSSEILSGLNMETGLRYSWVHSNSSFDDTFYDFPFDNANFTTSSVTGSAGIHYRIDRNLSVNANFATGFRAPNIDDISKVFDSTPGFVMIPNPHLRPEYIYSLEAGVHKTFGKILHLHFMGYYSWLHDALVRRNFELNGEEYLQYHGELSRIQAVQNASEAIVYGGIAEAEINLNRNLKVIGALNFTHGTEELDDGTTAPMRHAAPLFGNLALEFKRNKFNLNIEYRFNARINAEDLPPSEIEKAYMYALDAHGKPYSPAWSVLDLTTQYQINKHILLNFRLENILDKRYRPFASGISAPGRNFVISLRTNL
ncbi:MAG: TonB-dependent receptor [Flavobacteriaceae bacterium]|nr:TonB-dependent receptor [Flavobacteriaceae bacterium]